VTNANPSFAYGGTAAPLLFKNTLTGTYSGTISGDGVVGSYAAADQRPVFSGSNTYTGGTLIWGSIGYTNASAFGTGTISAQDTSARISNDSGSTLTLANPISIAGGMVAGFTGTGVTQLTGTLTGGSDTSLFASAGGVIDLTQQSSTTMSGFSGLTKVGGGDAKIWTTGDANFGSSSAIWFIGSTGTYNALVAKASAVSISKPILIGTASSTDASLTYYATFDTNANRMTITGSLGNNVGDGTNPSAGGVKKIGTGTLIMSGTSTYTLPTTVFEGSLLVNGALLTTGTVSVQAGASLGGYGSVGAVTGAGLIGPGNSPGILSATSVDPAGGLAFAFEFTQANPNYLAVSASGNDVLRLTDGSTPFVTSLTSVNEVDVYLTQSAVAIGTLTGGFFTNTQVDFLASVSNANYRYFVQSISGSYSYNGQSYQTLAQYDASKSVTVSTIAAGSGQVTQFVITVPEPSTLVALGAGAGSIMLWRRRRRAMHAASADADFRLAD